MAIAIRRISKKYEAMIDSNGQDIIETIKRTRRLPSHNIVTVHEHKIYEVNDTRDYSEEMLGELREIVPERFGIDIQISRGKIQVSLEETIKRDPIALDLKKEFC